jgi:hypothetical protein
MRVVMDSDCLVKLTKAGAKAEVVSGMEVHIPPLVKAETVDEAKEKGYQDGIVIEMNIAKTRLHVVKPKKKTAIPAAAKGEADAVSLFLDGSYDAIASDDRRFLKRLESANIPYLTPAACIVYLHSANRIEKVAASALLESLKPFISKEEYVTAKLRMEAMS